MSAKWGSIYAKCICWFTICITWLPAVRAAQKGTHAVCNARVASMRVPLHYVRERWQYASLQCVTRVLFTFKFRRFCFLIYLELIVNISIHFSLKLNCNRVLICSSSYAKVYICVIFKCSMSFHFDGDKTFRTKEGLHRTSMWMRLTEKTTWKLKILTLTCRAVHKKTAFK